MSRKNQPKDKDDLTDMQYLLSKETAIQKQLDGRKRLTKILNDLTPDEDDAIFDRIRKRVIESGPHDCWIGSSSLTQEERNHPKTTIKGEKIITARFMAQWNIRPEKLFFEDDASHLCGVSNCVNPDHIWPESGLLNLSREMCQAMLGDPRYPGFKCQHKFPKCLSGIRAEHIKQYIQRTQGLAATLASRNEAYRKNKRKHEELDYSDTDQHADEQDDIGEPKPNINHRLRRPNVSRYIKNVHRTYVGKT